MNTTTTTAPRVALAAVLAHPGRACRDVDTDVFYAEGTRGPALEQITRAKLVCAACPVIDQCKTWALETAEEFGVWGGLAEDERRAILRRDKGLRARVRAYRGQGDDEGQDDDGQDAARLVTVPVGGSRREYAAAWRAAVASGEPVKSVARRFNRLESTIERYERTGQAS